jgi:hypothetical protein
MGLLDKVKALANQGEQAVEKIVDAAAESTKTVVDKAENVVDEVVEEGRKGAGFVGEELHKARGIASGGIDGFAHASPTYAERFLTDAEKDLARTVFEETLPYGAIYLSNGLGLQSRAYTIPHPLHLGSYVVHIGPDAFPDATNSAVILLGQTADAVFIHELTHVWQGVSRRHAFDYILDSVYNQIRFGNDAYDLNQADVGKKKWSEFNAEQQAMIVENWYAGGMVESDDAFSYIKNNIRARTP